MQETQLPPHPLGLQTLKSAQPSCPSCPQSQHSPVKRTLHHPALGLQHCLWSPGICFQHTPSVLCRPLPVTRIRSFLCFT